MKKVIITNDGSAALQRLVKEFENNGFEVQVVESDGKELESLIEKDIPDILITDAFMKNCDALDVLALLGEKLKKCGAKVFVKAALKNRHYENRLLKFGADAYLLKPVKFESIAGKKSPSVTEVKGSSPLCIKKVKRV